MLLAGGGALFWVAEAEMGRTPAEGLATETCVMVDAVVGCSQMVCRIDGEGGEQRLYRLIDKVHSRHRPGDVGISRRYPSIGILPCVAESV